MNIHDYIFFAHDGKWHAKVEKINYNATFERGWDAVLGLVKFCTENKIEFNEFDNDVKEWHSYYKSADHFFDYMMQKKYTMPPGEWSIAFSCDAPNKPGYYRANND